MLNLSFFPFTQIRTCVTYVTDFRTQTAQRLSSVACSAINTLSFPLALANFLMGRHVESHTQKAPEALKKLSKSLSTAFKTCQLNPEKSKQLTKSALTTFFSTSHYDRLIQTSQNLTLLKDFYLRLHLSSDKEFRSLLTSSRSIVQKSIAKHEGVVTRIKNCGKKVLNRAINQMVDQIKQLPDQFSDKELPHPLKTLRKILNREKSRLNESLIKACLEQLNLPAIKIKNLPDSLNQFLRTHLKTAQFSDFRRFEKACLIEQLNPNRSLHLFSTKELDQLFITYEKVKELNPPIPSNSHLPKAFHWEKKTTYANEREKTLNLFSSLSLFFFFNRWYRGDIKTEEGFYQVLATCDPLSPSERQRRMIAFFENERKRLGGAWTPQFIDHYLFNFTYSKTNLLSSYLLETTPFLENVQLKLRNPLLPSLSEISEKCATFFHYLTSQYYEWSINHAYEQDADSFLKEKLYEKQKKMEKHLDLNFFFPNVNCLRPLQTLESSLSQWANRPIFDRNSRLNRLNVIKHLGALFPKLGIQLLKIPTIFFQFALTKIYKKIMASLLIHSSLLEEIHKFLMLESPPSQFPLLEILATYLQDISEMIETSSQEKSSEHSHVKRSLQKAIKAFLTFAKTEESLNPKESSHDLLLLDTILPTLIDKAVEVMLKIESTYKKEKDLESAKIKVLQALNAYSYKQSFSKETEKTLIKHNQSLKKLIDFYMGKIIRSLLIQMSKEQLPPKIGELIQKLLFSEKISQSKPPLQNDESEGGFLKTYLNQKNSAVSNLLKKPYLFKALLIRLMTKNPSF